MKCDSREMKRKIHESNGGDLPAIKHPERTSLPFYSDTAMTSPSGSPELANSKKELVSRKCAARKHLMENIYTRQPTVKRSYTFVAGEKLVHDGYFPHLSSSMDEAVKEREKRNRTTKLYTSATQIQLRRTRSEKDSASAEKSRHTIKDRKGKKKISLPEILMDISLSAKQQSRLERRTPENGEKGDTSENGDFLEYLNKGLEKEKLQAAKYRPITPGVIHKLGRLQLSSKQKAAQWVKTIPTDKKYFYGDNYLLGHPDLDINRSGWIYSDD